MARPRRPGARNHFVLIVLVLAAVGALAAAGSQLDGPRGEGRASARSQGAESAGARLTIAWASRPRSLDPAFASDRTAATLAWNLMDPLVKLGGDLEAVPNLARGWSISRDGRRVTFRLRPDGRWTNGEPVTARDFEYAWKRVLSPELDSPHASRLFAIEGARAYNACATGCDRLRARVGIDAQGDGRLAVTLRAPQPWFVAQTAHVAFLPVPALTVERLGDSWTAPKNLVTSGPFRLERATRESVDLIKNKGWRNAGDVALERIEGRIVQDARARLEAFDSRQVMALDGSALPAREMPQLRERREFEVYEALGTYAYAFNLASVIDVHQRRAMALAVDRAALVDNVVEGSELPATALIPRVNPRAGDEAAASAWLPAEGDLAEARRELDRAAVVKRRLTLLHKDEPGHREIALSAARNWEELGIQTTLRAQAAEGYLDFRGPLSRDSVDLYAVDRPYRYADAMAGLELWRCRAGGNKTNFCNAGYDRLLERARRVRDAALREVLYERAEQVLVGEDGRMPVLPLFWQAFANLEALSVIESFAIDPLGQIDLSTVEIDS